MDNVISTQSLSLPVELVINKPSLLVAWAEPLVPTLLEMKPSINLEPSLYIVSPVLNPPIMTPSGPGCVLAGLLAAQFAFTSCVVPFDSNATFTLLTQTWSSE